MSGSASFILFQGRIINTAHIASLIPPRPDGGRFVIEARMVGNVSFAEEYEDDEEAAGRYLALASLLLGDDGIAAATRRDDSTDSTDVGGDGAANGAEAENVLGDPALDEIMRKLRSELAEAENIDVR